MKKDALSGFREHSVSVVPVAFCSWFLLDDNNTPKTFLAAVICGFKRAPRLGGGGGLFTGVLGGS